MSAGGLKSAAPQRSPAAGPNPAGPDWAAVLRSLAGLRTAVSAVQQVAIASIEREHADELVGSAAGLARSLAEQLPLLQQAAAHRVPVPTEVALQLQQLGADLQRLTQINARLSAKTQRALEVLFPAEQVQVYSRLAGRASPFANGGSSSAYLKV